MDIWGPAKTTTRRTFAEKHWREPLKWNAAAESAGVRRRVFCASMADVFEDHPQLAVERVRLWSLIEQTPNLDWLLLTKRPENIASMLPFRYFQNVWLGTSTEDQQRADERIPILLKQRWQVPVLFLSVEPQLEDICLWPYLRDIDWVITGGESGPNHRPFDIEWAQHTRSECAEEHVAWHFKQVGGRTHAAGGCLLDGIEHKAFPTPRAA